MTELIDQRWQDYYKQLEGIDVNKFYEHPVIKKTICMDSEEDFIGEAKEYKKEIDKIYNKLDEHPLLKTLIKTGNKFSKGTELYIVEAAMIMRRFPEFFTDNKVVVEVGCGYGGLCRIIKFMNPDLEYILIDHPLMLNIAKNFLKDFNKITYQSLDILSPDVDNVIIGQASQTLLISNNCISEMATRCKVEVIKNFTLFDNIFIIDVFDFFIKDKLCVYDIKDFPIMKNLKLKIYTKKVN